MRAAQISARSGELVDPVEPGLLGIVLDGVSS
jgi:hypothetical protein